MINQQVVGKGCSLDLLGTCRYSVMWARGNIHNKLASLFFMGLIYNICTLYLLFRVLRLDNRGPLLELRAFHFGMIQHCSLHNVNLGLAYTANGGALMLLANVLFAFGPPSMELKFRLRNAYRDFRAWMKVKKIYCSQGMFKESMVTQLPTSTHFRQF